MNTEAINPGVRAALDWIAAVDAPTRPTMRHLRLDSRTVRPGDVFVAVPGAAVGRSPASG